MQELGEIGRNWKNGPGSGKSRAETARKRAGKGRKEAEIGKNGWGMTGMMQRWCKI